MYNYPADLKIVKNIQSCFMVVNGTVCYYIPMISCLISPNVPPVVSGSSIKRGNTLLKLIWPWMLVTTL